jgi:hypothetical protein
VVWVALGVVVAGKASAEPSSATPKVIEALDGVRNLTRPKQDGYTTVWDGDKYVQCHALSDQSLSCEAAGALMQPSLERVLTSERKQRLASLGWRLDPSFGVYTQVFAPSLTLDQSADRILSVLSQAYGADLTRIEVQTRWVAHQACPPRRGPGQTLAGLVDDDPSLAPTAVHGCAYSPPANLAAKAPGASVSGASDPATGALMMGAFLAGAAATSDPLAGGSVAGPPVVVDPVALYGPRERRGRRPRTSSGRRSSSGTRHSRSGSHSSHRK